MYLQEVTDQGMGKKFSPVGNKALIGRNVNADIPVNSSSVSRNHALLEFTKQKGWCITDNRSINGVYIDQRKLKPAIPYPLNNGETVSLGPPELTKYKFMFYENSKGKKSKSPSGGVESKLNQSQLESGLPGCSKQPDHSTSMRVTRQSAAKRAGTQEISHSPKKASRLQPEAGTTLKEHLQTVDTLLKMNEELDKRVKKLLHRSERRLYSVEPCSQESTSLLSANRSFDDEYFEDAFANQSTEDYNTTLSHRRQNHKGKNNAYGDSEGTELIQSQNNQKQPAAGDEVISLRERVIALEKALQEREQARTELENRLKEIDNETANRKQEQEKEQAKSTVEDTKLLQQTVNAEIANEFGKLMETELTCSICTELFIKATTLECAHTFCAYCLATWRKTKKECPICRAAINTATHSLVIDGFIDKMVERLSPEEQEKRKSVVEDRIKSMQPKKKEKKPKARRTRRPATRSNTSRSPGHTTDGIDNNPYLDANFMDQILLDLVFHDTMTIDIPDTYDDDDDDDDAPVEGYGYYGGYGRCYNCGRNGHWANGCPDM